MKEMLKACILVKTVPVQTDEVLEAIRKVEGVRKAFIAYGRFDLIAFVTSKDYDGIVKLTAAINSLAAVRSTETLVEA